MLKEAIEHVESSAKQFIKPEFVKLPGDPKHVHWLRVGNQMNRYENANPVRRVTLERLDDLVYLGLEHFDKAIGEAGKMAAFYDDTCVQLVFDTSNGRERATVDLVHTEEYAFFKARYTTPAISVQDLRAALRWTISDCFNNPVLVKQISNINFQANDNQAVNLDRAKESMGAMIQRETLATEGLPDERQSFSVRMFKNADLQGRHSILCTLDPDNQNRRWLLRPTESSMTDFIEANMSLIRGTLEDKFKDAIPVYQGRFHTTD